MENQHRKITGYRELTAEEIALMNEVKAKGEEMEKLLAKVDCHLANQVLQARDAGEEEQERLAEAEPRRWFAVGRTHLQEGLMALTRAIAQPTTF
jgi:hypothetical protein